MGSPKASNLAVCLHAGIPYQSEPQLVERLTNLPADAGLGKNVSVCASNIAVCQNVHYTIVGLMVLYDYLMVRTRTNESDFVD